MRCLYFVIILIFITACQDKSASATAETAAEAQAKQDSLHRQSPEVKKICLDTAWLHDHGFTYQLLRTIDGMHWTITYPVRLDQLPQVDGGTFMYTASSDTACSSISISLTAIAIDLGKHTQDLQVPAYYMHTLPDLLSPDIQFEDYNFDGHMDFSVYSSGSSNSNTVRSYYLFDVPTKQFKFSTLLSNTVSNAQFNTDEKTITTSWYAGHAGRIGGTATYRFFNADSLLLLHKTDQDFSDSIDGYIRIARKRLSDGSYIETIDTILQKEIE